MTFYKDYTLTRVTADALLNTGAARVWRVQVNGGSDASSLALFNTVDGSGTRLWDGVAPFTDADASAAESKTFDFESVGGLQFSAFLYADITGTGATAYVWWETDV